MRRLGGGGVCSVFHPRAAEDSGDSDVDRDDGDRDDALAERLELIIAPEDGCRPPRPRGAAATSPKLERRFPTPGPGIEAPPPTPLLSPPPRLNVANPHVVLPVLL